MGRDKKKTMLIRTENDSRVFDFLMKPNEDGLLVKYNLSFSY